VPYNVHKYLGGGSHADVYSLRSAGKTTPDFIGKVFLRKRTRTDEMFLRSVNKDYYVAAAIKERLRSPFVSDETRTVVTAGTAAPIELAWADIDQRTSGQRAIVLLFPFEDTVSLFDYMEEKLDKIRTHITYANPEGIIKTPSDTHKSAVWRWQVWRISALMCELVAHLHKLRVYHGDVKLENFVVMNVNPETTAITRGMLKIIDFGAAGASEEFPGIVVQNAAIISYLTTSDLSAYAATTVYADPRTYVVDPYLRWASKLNVGGLKVFEISHPSDDTLAKYFLDLETRIPEVTKNAAGQDVMTNHKILYVMHANEQIPTLWPQFDTYSTAASIFYMINREQRAIVFQQRVQDLPVKFTEFPKVKKHKPEKDELITHPLQIKALTNILSGITNGAVARDAFSRDMGRRDAAVKSMATKDLQSAAVAFFALALDWQLNYSDFRDHLKDLAEQADRTPAATTTTTTTSSLLSVPSSEPRSNTLQRSATTSRIRDAANLLAHFGTPEVSRGRSRSPPRSRRNTNNDDDDDE